MHQPYILSLIAPQSLYKRAGQRIQAPHTYILCLCTKPYHLEKRRDNKNYMLEDFSQSGLRELRVCCIVDFTLYAYLCNKHKFDTIYVAHPS